LQYDLTQGKNQQRILEQVRRNGLPLPAAIENAPVLSPGLQYYYSAYMDLATCRGGMGDGDIPWTAVREYARLEGLNDEDFKRMWTLVKGLDFAYLKHQQEQSKKKHGKL
jgi:hypothetical protein